MALDPFPPPVRRFVAGHIHSTAELELLLLLRGRRPVVVDLSLVPGTDLSVWRSASGLTAFCLLLYGLIFDVGRRR